MKAAFAALLLSITMVAAQPAAPPISAKPLDPGRPFPGWTTYRGNFVVVDFWATWCGPCIPGLDKVVAMEKEFAGSKVRFLTVANDTSERVRKYFLDKSISVHTFVDEEDERGTFKAFGVAGIPAAAVVDPEGRLMAVTPGENLTPDVVRKLLAGETPDLPRFDRLNNLTWDKDEITWQDGVMPMFQAIIKRIDVRGAGSMHKPGSNHISGDGLPVQGMIQSAWRTDFYHVDRRGELPEGSYRFAVTVPKGRESELFPAFQDALQRTFGFKAQWEDQQRDVLVLTRTGVAALADSESAPLVQFLRGKIMLRKQPVSKLAEMLPNWLKMPVVDETGYSGSYDFDLEYRDDGPSMLTDGLREKYGLTLTPAKRAVRMLVVRAEH